MCYNCEIVTLEKPLNFVPVMHVLQADLQHFFTLEQYVTLIIPRVVSLSLVDSFESIQERVISLPIVLGPWPATPVVGIAFHLGQRLLLLQGRLYGTREGASREESLAVSARLLAHWRVPAICTLSNSHSALLRVREMAPNNLNLESS
mgnify:CR=1 FL=1